MHAGIMQLDHAMDSYCTPIYIWEDLGPRTGSVGTGPVIERVKRATTSANGDMSLNWDWSLMRDCDAVQWCLPRHRLQYSGASKVVVR